MPAYRAQPPGETPFKLAITGIETRSLRFSNELEIAIGAEIVGMQVRQVVERLRKAFAAPRKIGVDRLALQIELFFKK